MGCEIRYLGSFEIPVQMYRNVGPRYPRPRAESIQGLNGAVSNLPGHDEGKCKMDGAGEQRVPGYVKLRSTFIEIGPN